MSTDQWFHGTYYLSGQMRPLPENNFPLFEHAARLLRADGFSIVSPHEFGQQTWTRGQLMAEDLNLLINECNGIFVMPGWQNSPGACAEVAAAFACEKTVWDLAVTSDSYELVPCGDTHVWIPRENQYQHGIPLVGLCGFAQSGKDTAAKFLVEKYGWTRVAFADALRDVLYALNPTVVDGWGVEADEIEISQLVEIVDEIGWDKAKVEYGEIRRLLQRLGTEAGRDIIDQNLWVGMGEDKIEAAGGPVVITDCRFPNEVNMVRRRKGTLIWVERDGVGAANAHASEHSVTKADCDLVLTNNGTIEDLHNSLSQVFGTLS